MFHNHHYYSYYYVDVHEFSGQLGIFDNMPEMFSDCFAQDMVKSVDNILLSQHKFSLKFWVLERCNVKSRIWFLWFQNPLFQLLYFIPEGEGRDVLLEFWVIITLRLVILIENLIKVKTFVVSW